MYNLIEYTRTKHTALELAIKTFCHGDILQALSPVWTSPVISHSVPHIDPH